MKKFLAYLLVALMFVSSFAACGNNNAGNEETSHLKKAADYIYAMYKDKGTSTAKDFERTAQVIIGTTKYAVEWTTDNEAVKVTTNGTVATIDVAERSETEIKYTLTATVKDADGKTESVSFNYTVPKWEGFTKIVEEAYKLEAGKAMDGACTLEGTITKIDTAWSDSYKNITVTIAVPGIEDKPIMCYRLAPTNKDDADLVAQCAGLKVGDYITVTGTIKNYNGTIEFDAGCTLDALVPGEGEAPKTPEDVKVPTGATEAEIVDLAYTLENGQKFAAEVTLTGVITSIKEAYTDQYKNISVIVQVGDKADKLITFFRMKGDGIENLKVGDTVTATGIMKNYNGTIEFDAGCKYVAPAIDWSAQYVGDYSAHIIPVADFAAYTEGFTLTFKYETLKDGYSYWNFTFINNTDGWPKLLDAKYYVEKPKFSEWDFVDVSGNGTYTVTFTKDAVAELVTAGGLGIQVFGMVAHDIVLTPVGEVSEVVDLTTPEGIVNATYQLEDGTYLADKANFTLTGVVTSTTYNEKYGDATTYIVVAGMTDKPLMCYQLKGEVANLKEGDIITVTGPLKNYKGTYEFERPTLDKVEAGTETPDEPATPTYATAEEILKALYALEDGQSLEGTHTLVGVIDSFKYTYSPDFDSIQCTIIVDGLKDYPVVCYKLKGADIDKVEVGDTITVSGELKNYKGTYEFNGCTLDAFVKAEAPAATAAVLNANDLAAATIAETTTFGAFTITANADATVTIDGNKKVSDTGIEFTQRIKLGGTGKVEARSVSFTTTGAATVTVYAMSSSSGEDRNLVLMSADGTALATGLAFGTVTDSTIPAITYEITEAGTYFLGSEKSGINIYYIEVK